MDKATTVWRTWVLLSHIPRAPGRISVTDLRARLAEHQVDVDVRTLQRDLMSLTRYFPLIHDDNKPRGWSYSSQAARHDLPGMDAHGAIAFSLVESYLQGQLPRVTLAALEPHFKTAREVLRGMKRRGLPAWTERVHVAPRSQPLLAPRVAPEVLAHVYDALLQERTLRVRYHSRRAASVLSSAATPPSASVPTAGEGREGREALVHPQGLLFREAVAYLACTFWDYQDVRLLALHRIAHAAVGDETRKVVPGFSLQAFAEEGGAGWKVGGPPLALVLRFAPEAAAAVVETPLSAQQEVDPLADGRVEVRASVPHTRVLEAWLRSFGPAVEVVAPAALRDEMIAAADAMRARYARANEGTGVATNDETNAPADARAPHQTEPADA